MRLPIVNRITGSRYEIAQVCLAPFVTPKHQLAWDEKPSWASRLGSGFHKAAHQYTETGSIDYGEITFKYSLTPKQVERIKGRIQNWLGWLEKQDTRNWKCEKKYWVDPINLRAEHLDTPGERDYDGAPSGVYALTPDVLDITSDTAVIVDYKTGFFVAHPRYSSQMHMAACAVALAYPQVQDIRCKILKVQDVGIWELEHVFTRDAVLEVLIPQARETLERSLDVNTHEANPGDHCRRCPCKVSCPKSTFEAA